MVFDTEGALQLDASDYIAEAEDAAEASEELAESADETQESLFEFDEAGAAASGGIAAAGGAMQGAINESQDWRESLGRTSETMGITQDATEDLAGEISDATFPMDDAVETMDLLARRGIDSEEEMAEVAGTMDTLADATDDTAANITESVTPALNAFDEDLVDAEEHMDTFAWVARNTGQDVDEFSRFIEKNADDLQDMGVELDDAAGIMAELEDQGFEGREAITQFRQAANDTEGDMGDLTDELGISEDALDDQADAIADAEGMTEAHADAANESITTQDRLSAKFDDVMLQAGSLLGPIDALAPALMALGGAGMFISTVNVSALIPSLATLMTTILPLVAIVGVLAAAWKTDFMGIQDITKDTIGFVAEFIEGTLDRVWNDIIKPLLSAIEDAWDEHGETIMEAVSTAFATIESVIDNTLSVIWEDVLQPIIATIADAWDEHGDSLLQSATEAFENIKSVIDTVISTVWEGVLKPTIEVIEEAWNLFGDDIMAVAETVFNTVSAVVETQINNALEVFELFVDNFLLAVDAFLSILSGDFDEAFENIRQMIDNVFDTIKSIFDEAVGLLSDAANNIIDAVIGVFEDLVERVVGNSIIPEMIDDIKGVLVGLVDFVTDIWELPIKIIGVFDDIKDDALEIAGEIFDGLVETFTDIADAIGDTLREAFNTVVPSSIELPSVTVGGQHIGTTIAGREVGGSLPTVTIGGGSFDLPQLDSGGTIEEDGLAMVHEGEHIYNPAKADKGNPSPGGTTINIDTLVADDPRSAARELRKEMRSHNLDRSA